MPIIFKTVNGVSLQKPGYSVQKFANRAAAEKMGMQQHEKASRVMRAYVGEEGDRRSPGDHLGRGRKKKAKVRISFWL